MNVASNEAAESLKSRYRNVANRYFWGCVALLSVAIAMPFVAFFDIRPSFEALEVWVQRSGAITSIYALLSTTVADMGLRKLHKPGEAGDLYKLEVLKEVSFKFEVVRWTALFITVIGTLVWGYGDTVLKLLQ